MYIQNILNNEYKEIVMFIMLNLSLTYLGYILN